MPEGDTVYLAASRLNAALAGRTLTKTDFRYPTVAVEDLAGHAITEVKPRGKHFLFRTDRGITLHTHLKMSGSWRIARTGARIGGWDEVRVLLQNEAATAIGYNMPVVHIVSTVNEHDLIGHLGPDPLGADWDHEDAVARLRAHGDRELGDVLLDQTVICGWGNAYKNELCFLRGISPWTKVRDVANLDALVKVGRRALLLNRTTGRWVTTGNLRTGQGQYIFERQGKPCRRCGTLIQRTRQNGDGYMRWTYWCSTCQPGTPQAGDQTPSSKPSW
jgi:endonuclease-8